MDKSGEVIESSAYEFDKNTRADSSMQNVNKQDSASKLESLLKSED